MATTAVCPIALPQVDMRKLNDGMMIAGGSGSLDDVSWTALKSTSSTCIAFSILAPAHMIAVVI
jgi:hypothetical protein